MRVLGVNGSARSGGNTARLIRAVFEPLMQAGHECELVELAGRTLEGCTACDMCKRELDRRCHGRDDFGNELIAMMDDADAIVLGSPVYFSDVTAGMKALIERAGTVARANGDMLARKPAAAVVAVRRGGAIHTFDTLNHFFLIGQMVVAGSSYWNLGVGREPGEVEMDEEGMRTMRVLGENLAWLLERIA